MAVLQNLTLAESWVTGALTSRPMLMFAGISLASILLIALILRYMLKMGPAQTIAQRLRGWHQDDSGTTTIEFALCFPWLLAIVLILAQSMLLMAGTMYVNYAAYQATRRATIEIPADYTDRGDLAANMYSNDKYSLKYQHIQRAAAFAVLPVAGQFDSGSSRAGDMVAAIRNHYAAYGQSEPAWIESMLAGKVNYADAMTEIEVLETNVIDESDVSFDPLPQNPYRFGPRDVVTVEVKHKLNLGVPIASRIFAEGEHSGEGTGRYSTVTAHYTLPNEGVPVPLPEKPSIDRVTPSLPQATSNNPVDLNLN